MKTVMKMLVVLVLLSGTAVAFCSAAEETRTFVDDVAGRSPCRSISMRSRRPAPWHRSCSTQWIRTSS